MPITGQRDVSLSLCDCIRTSIDCLPEGSGLKMDLEKLGKAQSEMGTESGKTRQSRLDVCRASAHFKLLRERLSSNFAS